jgi:hypothetical protein
VDDAVYPGALEVNDGVDNQCPGEAGHGIVDETGPGSGFMTDSPDEYGWPGQLGATRYEVARSPAPDFSSGCVLFTTSTTSIVDPTFLGPGQIFYNLNRASAPQAGSWGADSDGVERSFVCP